MTGSLRPSHRRPCPPQGWDITELMRPFDLHTKHVWMASGDRQDRTTLEHCPHSAAIDISHRIPQQRSLGCHHQLSGLADPDFGSVLIPKPARSP